MWWLLTAAPVVVAVAYIVGAAVWIRRDRRRYFAERAADAADREGTG